MSTSARSGTCRRISTAISARGRWRTSRRMPPTRMGSDFQPRAASDRTTGKPAQFQGATMSDGYLIKISELSEILGVRNPRAFARRHGLNLSVVKDLGTVIHSRDLPKWQAK